MSIPLQCTDQLLPPRWSSGQCPPREREVVGSISNHNRPKSLKLVVVAFTLGAQDYGNSTANGPPVSG